MLFPVSDPAGCLSRFFSLQQIPPLVCTRNETNNFVDQPHHKIIRHHHHETQQKMKLSK